MNDDHSEQISTQQRLLSAYRRTLANYLEQSAIHGIAFVPPSIQYGIRDARDNIQRIKKILNDWRVQVSDDPNDYESSPPSLCAETTHSMHKPGEETLQEIKKILRIKRSGIEYRYIKEDEIKELSEIDEMAYGEDKTGFDVLTDWWRAYPKGFFIALQDEKIIGIFGLFPLSSEAFEDIKEGRRFEGQIRSADILSEDQAGSCQTWYVYGVLTPDREDLLAELLYEALSKWVESINPDAPLRIVSAAYTQGDEQLLELFSFHCYKKRDGKALPVYYYSRESLLHIKEVVRLLHETKT